jgi:CRISPR-associated endonuclease/helicase Cas3
MYNYWGKTNGEDYHLLVYHSYDCFLIADFWIENSQVLKTRFKNIKNEVLLSTLLHDIGKFSPFQTKNKNILKKIRTEEEIEEYCKRLFNKKELDHVNNGYCLLDYIKNFYSLNNNFDNWWMEVCFHHGNSEGEFDDYYFEQEHFINYDKNNIDLFLNSLKNIIDIKQLNFNNEYTSPMVRGFVSLCDWLASTENYLPFINQENIGLEEYKEKRLPSIKTMFENVGILRPQIHNCGINIFLFEPRGTQRIVDDIADDIISNNQKCVLVCIEDETGQGKTEAAIALASKMIKHNLGDSINICLPQQTITNTMYDRICDYKICEKVWGCKSNVSLNHGKSWLHESYQKRKKQNDDMWLFNHKDLSFLFPISVSTIDQELQSVLPVKFSYLRTFAITKSILIIDEVHDSDTYMISLVEELLKKQKKSGGSVIIMSATISIELKKRLFNIYRDDVGKVIKNDSYPLITVIGENFAKEYTI